MPKVILGIDPGLADTGFGIIREEKGQLKFLGCGSIKTAAKQPLADRLVEIYKTLNELIKKYKPEIISVEQLFFTNNAKTAIAVGQARGVVLLAASQNNLQIEEFTPLQIKVALTSYGQASKNQIQQMVKSVLNLSTIPKPDDAADALAAAICCANSLKIKGYGKKN